MQIIIFLFFFSCRISSAVYLTLSKYFKQSEYAVVVHNLSNFLVDDGACIKFVAAAGRIYYNLFIIISIFFCKEYANMKFHSLRQIDLAKAMINPLEKMKVICIFNNRL